MNHFIYPKAIYLGYSLQYDESYETRLFYKEQLACMRSTHWCCSPYAEDGHFKLNSQVVENGSVNK